MRRRKRLWQDFRRVARKAAFVAAFSAIVGGRTLTLPRAHFKRSAAQKPIPRKVVGNTQVRSRPRISSSQTYKGK